MISLHADTVSINMRGTNVVYLPVGETSGICYKHKNALFPQHIK